MLLSGEKSYFSTDEAAELLREIKSSDFATIGVEGFRCEGQSLIPLLDVIADWSSVSSESWHDFQTKCNRLSEEMIKEVAAVEKLCLTFVLLSREEYLSDINRT